MMTRGFERDGPGDADALALAAGEGVRVALAPGGLKADRRRSSSATRRVERPAARAPAMTQRLADDLAHGHARVERGERVLEDHPDLAPDVAQRALVERRAGRSSRAVARRGRRSAAGRSARRCAGCSGRAWSCPSPLSPTMPRFSPARRRRGRRRRRRRRSPSRPNSHARGRESCRGRDASAVAPGGARRAWRRGARTCCSSRRTEPSSMPGVGVLRARRRCARPAPCSTTLPWCMTSDLVGDLGDDAHVVGDEHHRHAVADLQALDQVEDLGLGGDVERGRRLVGDQHLRVAGERHGDHRALPHAAGELEGVAVDRGARGSGSRPGAAARWRGPRRSAAGMRHVEPQRLDDLVADACGPATASSSAPGRSSRSSRPRMARIARPRGSRRGEVDRSLPVGAV